MYYAVSNSKTGDFPEEYVYGDPEYDEVIAFRHKKDRDHWVTNTKLMTAKRLTIKQAQQATKWTPGSLSHSKHEYVRAVRMVSNDMSPEYIMVIQKSKYKRGQKKCSILYS